jgi:hypothetical protein
MAGPDGEPFVARYGFQQDRSIKELTGELWLRPTLVVQNCLSGTVFDFQIFAAEARHSARRVVEEGQVWFGDQWVCKSCAAGDGSPLYLQLRIPGSEWSSSIQVAIDPKRLSQTVTAVLPKGAREEDKRKTFSVRIEFSHGPSTFPMVPHVTIYTEAFFANETGLDLMYQLDSGIGVCLEHDGGLHDIDCPTDGTILAPYFGLRDDSGNLLWSDEIDINACLETSLAISIGQHVLALRVDGAEGKFYRSKCITVAPVFKLYNALSVAVAVACMFDGKIAPSSKVWTAQSPGRVSPLLVLAQMHRVGAKSRRRCGRGGGPVRLNIPASHNLAGRRPSASTLRCRSGSPRNSGAA